MNRNKTLLFSFILIAGSVILSLAVVELVLRLKNASMTNYDIEMWRYAHELKQPSLDPSLGFEHIKSKSAILQNIDIRLNEWGLRGPPVEPVPPNGRRILFLGGSITLGWGVPEDQTVEARLQRMLVDNGDDAQVLNGGVGNYNAERYVSRFFKQLSGLKPSDIVVQYFLRDAEDLEPGGGNAVLRNSELAVTLWIAYHRLLDRSGVHALEQHYEQVYDANQHGFQVMRERLRELSQYAKEHGIRIYLVMTPDVHNLIDYKFEYIHHLMQQVATGEGYIYIDLLPAMRGKAPQELFAMPGDPHPNALGHELMAEAIFPVIVNAGRGTAAR
jgi:lysophospholipase L1-like esterase